MINSYSLYNLKAYLKDRTAHISRAQIKCQLLGYLLEEINKNGRRHHLPVFGGYFTNTKDPCGTDHRVRIF